MVIFEDIKKQKAHLRTLRRVICFPVVNRGKVWYDLLTIEQEAELKQWYSDWLNVTDTLVIPKKPKWLSEKLDTEVEIL